jgi:gamma-glutamyltranspeptidase/glutathione hydrolase
LINTLFANKGMATSPHHLASQSAIKVLRDGGNAIEAMVAAAATIAVVYPHMNSIGGDGFWLILKPNGEQIAIDASGASAASATIDTYLDKGLQKIPFRGAIAANTVAGTISGWQKALEVSATLGGNKSLDQLLNDAIQYADEGFPVTEGQSELTKNKLAELKDIPGFAKSFLVEGQAPKPMSIMTNRPLANTLKKLSIDGLDSFYRGELAQQIAKDLKSVGSPITLEDLQQHVAQIKEPLHLQHSLGDLYNVQPPSQGLVSLIILGLLDRTNLKNVQADSADHVHLVVEATKLAFRIRDSAITDPSYMSKEAQEYLDPSYLDNLATSIRIDQAMSWGEGKGPGDTIWMGTVDKDGLAVSFIQSIYHEYGSGIVLESTGINWQNRGASFSLDKNHINALLPRKKPFHTLNPAGARFNDGRVMVYGNMGGDGQPQSQAAVFTRYAVFNQPLQTAVTAPRWLLGRTWGQSSDTLKLESRFPQAVFDELTTRGHEVEKMGEFDSALGHAGAIVRLPNGVLLGATDPRADGVVAAF